MVRYPITTLIIVLLLGVPILSAQTFCNDSLGANSYQNLPVNDWGSTIRGGVNFQPFADPTRNPTLFGGVTVEMAMRECPTEINAPGDINGVETPDMGIVATVLESSGVPPDFAAQITGTIGEFRLTADGTVFSQAGEKQCDSVFAAYEELLEVTMAEVTAAVKAFEDDAVPTGAVLAKLSGPGFPVRTDTLREIAREPDAGVRTDSMQCYASKVAYRNMMWDIHELLDVLQNSAASSTLTPEIRGQLEMKRCSLWQQVARIQDITLWSQASSARCDSACATDENLSEETVAGFDDGACGSLWRWPYVYRRLPATCQP